jgi:hypothetical protein
MKSINNADMSKYASGFADQKSLSHRRLNVGPFITNKGVPWKADTPDGRLRQNEILLTCIASLEIRLDNSGCKSITPPGVTADKILYHLCLNMLSELQCL